MLQGAVIQPKIKYIQGRIGGTKKKKKREGLTKRRIRMPYASAFQNDIQKEKIEQSINGNSIKNLLRQEL